MLDISASNQILRQLDDKTLNLVAQRLPKIETHRHLEAGFSLERFLEVAITHGVDLPSNELEGLRPHVQIGANCRSLTVFLKKFPFIQTLFISREAITDITYFTLRDAAAENIKHLELRFAPACMAEAHNLDLHDVMKGVLEGAARGKAASDIGVSLIVIAERHRGVDHAFEMKDLALQYRNQGIVGFDLAGDEFHFPPAPFAKPFQEAKEGGLKITAHASEAAEAENVRIVIEEFGAERVGHAARLMSAPDIVELVKSKDIHIEACPECNIRIGSVKGGYRKHPLPQFLSLGLNVGINTDDPLILGTSATSERVVAVRKLKLDFEDLRTLDLNAAQACFISDDERAQLVNQVQAGYSEVAAGLVNGELLKEFKK